LVNAGFKITLRGLFITVATIFVRFSNFVGVCFAISEEEISPERGPIMEEELVIIFPAGTKLRLFS